MSNCTKSAEPVCTETFLGIDAGFVLTVGGIKHKTYQQNLEPIKMREKKH